MFLTAQSWHNYHQREQYVLQAGVLCCYVKTEGVELRVTTSELNLQYEKMEHGLPGTISVNTMSM